MFVGAVNGHRSSVDRVFGHRRDVGIDESIVIGIGVASAFRVDVGVD